MPTTYNDPIMLDSTGQDIVDKLDSIASLMGDGVIDDTSTTATDKTWSASKENTTVNGLKSNINANTKLIKDTVGWSGKNLLENKAVSGTNRGVVFTVNGDKSITANGTAEGGNAFLILNFLTADDLPSGNYIVSIGNPQSVFGVMLETYNGDTWVASLINVYSQDEQTITVDWNGYNRIRVIALMSNGQTASNLRIYPMIRPADILDPTYEPYFGSTAFPRSEQAVLGAKNRLPFVTPNNTVLNGVTYSYDKNGLTLNGTVNVDTYFNYTVAKFSDMPDIVGKTITISLEGNQSNDFMFLQIHHYDGTSQKAIYVNGNELTLTVTEAVLSDSNSGFYLQIPAGHSGYQFNNFVVKPMIRDSADPDPTYAPYAMTNRELTKKVTIVDFSNDVEVVTGLTAYEVSSFKATRCGNVVNLHGEIKSLTEDGYPAGRSIIEVLTGIPRPYPDSYAIDVIIAGASENVKPAQIDLSQGKLKMRGGTPTKPYLFNITYITNE